MAMTANTVDGAAVVLVAAYYSQSSGSVVVLSLVAVAGPRCGKP